MNQIYIFYIWSTNIWKNIFQKNHIFRSIHRNDYWSKIYILLIINKSHHNLVLWVSVKFTTNKSILRDFTQTISHTEKVFLKIRKRVVFSDRSSREEYCGTASILRKATITAVTQLQILININEKKEIIMIDLDAINNFIT